VSDSLNAAVDRLSRVTGVRGAMIVEADAGVPVVAELKQGVEGGAVAALASSLFRRTDLAGRAADFGPVVTLQLDASDGHVIVANSGELLVVVIIERGSQLGLIRLKAHQEAEALR
jgi:predicted regulator of Ras-like GTPase activity (Roadblock/LC7/MglB family)